METNALDYTCGLSDEELTRLSMSPELVQESPENEFAVKAYQRYGYQVSPYFLMTKEMEYPLEKDKNVG